MIRFTVGIQIARPPADVFAYATDPTKLGTWQTNTVSAVAEGDGALGVGTRIREVHRAPGGQQLTSLVEVSEYEPGRVFGLRMLEGQLPLHARMTFDSIDLGTHVRFAAHGRTRGAMRLVEPLLRVTLKRQFAGYCTVLKHVLESGAAAM